MGERPGQHGPVLERPSEQVLQAIEESRITLEASFTEDLSADSLALIELVEAIEQELEDRAEGFRIEDEDLADLRTVRDAVDYVVERVG